MAKLRQLVKLQKATVLATDKASGKILFSLPRTATLLAMYAQVVVAFDATTPVLDLGISSDDNYWVDSVDLDDIAFLPITLLHGGHLEEMSLNGPVTDITAMVDVTGTPTVGKVIVIVVYADPFVNPGAV